MTTRAGVSTKPSPPRDLLIAGVLFAIATLVACSFAAVIVYVVGYTSGYNDAQKLPCDVEPKVIYRRGVDTHSPEELRRIAGARERMEKVTSNPTAKVLAGMLATAAITWLAAHNAAPPQVVAPAPIAIDAGAP